MKFAIVEGQRAEPSPKRKGICPFCASQMIAKCGRVKMWHWAHLANASCDPWWEHETEWHREWKDRFPRDWQEVVHLDTTTGEKHIADVKTPAGLVVEFQHSRLDPGERASRENFYGNLIWIIDGKRGGLDESFFRMGLSGPIQESPLAFQIDWLGSSRLLHFWAESKARVYLDFGDDVVWRLLLFDPQTKIGAVGPLPKDTLVEDCYLGCQISVIEKEEGAD